MIFLPLGGSDAIKADDVCVTYSEATQQNIYRANKQD